jgi:hypothetical protein
LFCPRVERMWCFVWVFSQSMSMIRHYAGILGTFAGIGAWNLGQVPAALSACSLPAGVDWAEAAATGAGGKEEVVVTAAGGLGVVAAVGEEGSV